MARRDPRNRFWSFVQKGPGCWLWCGGSFTDGGYGLFHVDGKIVRAHRYSYLLEHGSIPKGQVVMHLCDEPSCVRPTHIQAGTHADNTADMMAKRRGKYVVRSGDAHPRATLTSAIVEEARQLYRAGGATIASLADRYGVSRTTLGDALRGVTWR